MSGATYTQQYTWDDFIALPDDDRRELIDGELIEVDVPNEPHERAVWTLIVLLGSWCRGGGAQGYLSAYKVKVNEKRGVMPDIHIYLPGNDADRREQGVVAGHPDLCVEVISPGSARYDRGKKLHWYAAIGVPEYWIVDPEQRLLERFVLRADGFYSVLETHTDDAIFRPESFPGLEIPLAELWSVTPPAED